MVGEFAQTYAVTAAAMITAGAATYVAAVARSIYNRVESADERSKQNRRLLTGETVDGEEVHYDGILDRLERVEAERQRQGGGR